MAVCADNTCSVDKSYFNKRLCGFREGMRNLSVPGACQHVVANFNLLNGHGALVGDDWRPGNEALIREHRVKRPVVAENLHQPFEVLVVDGRDHRFAFESFDALLLGADGSSDADVAHVGPLLHFAWPGGLRNALRCQDQSASRLAEHPHGIERVQRRRCLARTWGREHIAAQVAQHEVDHQVLIFARHVVHCQTPVLPRPASPRSVEESSSDSSIAH